MKLGKKTKKKSKTKQDYHICEIQAIELMCQQVPREEGRKKIKTGTHLPNLMQTINCHMKRKWETWRKISRPRQCSTSTPKGQCRKFNQKKTIFWVADKSNRTSGHLQSTNSKETAEQSGSAQQKQLTTQRNRTSRHRKLREQCITRNPLNTEASPSVTQ